MAIVTVGVRRITQPIAQLIRAAQEIAGGHFGRRITATSGDELEELAGQFNLNLTTIQQIARAASLAPVTSSDRQPPCCSASRRE